MLLAKHLGATNIYLLGFDLKITNNKKHFFGDHKANLSNATTMKDWNRLFVASMSKFDTIRVVNCTRETALTIYEQINLKEIIC